MAKEWQYGENNKNIILSEQNKQKLANETTMIFTTNGNIISR